MQTRAYIFALIIKTALSAEGSNAAVWKVRDQYIPLLCFLTEVLVLVLLMLLCLDAHAGGGVALEGLSDRGFARGEPSWLKFCRTMLACVLVGLNCSPDLARMLALLCNIVWKGHVAFVQNVAVSVAVITDNVSYYRFFIALLV